MCVLELEKTKNKNNWTLIELRTVSIGKSLIVFSIHPHITDSPSLSIWYLPGLLLLVLLCQLSRSNCGIASQLWLTGNVRRGIWSAESLIKGPGGEQTRLGMRIGDADKIGRRTDKHSITCLHENQLQVSDGASVFKFGGVSCSFSTASLLE